MTEPRIKGHRGWSIDEQQRQRLLSVFRPRWPDVVADHVTLGKAGPNGLPSATIGQIVGIADDGTGLEALIIEIDGDVIRPDGNTFHATWSLDRARGRKPVQSNDVIATRGWTAIATPVEVMLVPTLI